MPFTSYNSSLDPEAMAAAQTAFDMTWAEINLPHDLDEQTARDMIARRIMDHAVDTGERDPERLKAYALEGFSLQQSA